MIKYRKSFIVGLKGISITKNEIFFLKKYKPWGVILFSRNIKSIEQTQKLIKKIKSIFNDINYPILIDQEGGKVTRLEKLIVTTAFSGEYFGNIYKNNQPLNINEDTKYKITSSLCVGHYAIRIQWGDGHNGGIYSFDLLNNFGVK